ncbi:MAG: FMN-binding negative transcriptional regulator [Granulosicoccaceae bacterium]
MFIPPPMKEDRLDVLHSLIDQHPFGAVVTCGADGPTAEHIPFVVHSELTTNGTLRGHVAIRNPIVEAASAEPNTLVIFQGPHTYISPSWYASKAEHGKVVPTWNYAIVHAYGKLTVTHDETWLREHLASLTLAHEANQPIPWKPEDAPAKFLGQQIKGIVGIEIKIDRFQGKWKISQNKNAADKSGVVAGLREVASENATAMADLVQEP